MKYAPYPTLTDAEVGRYLNAREWVSVVGAARRTGLTYAQIWARADRSGLLGRATGGTRVVPLPWAVEQGPAMTIAKRSMSPSAMKRRRREALYRFQRNVFVLVTRWRVEQRREDDLESWSELGHA